MLPTCSLMHRPKNKILRFDQCAARRTTPSRGGTRANHFRHTPPICAALKTGWIRRVMRLRHRPTRGLLIVTVGPIPQRLPIHAAVFCRRLAIPPSRTRAIANIRAPLSHPGTAPLPGEARLRTCLCGNPYSIKASLALMPLNQIFDQLVGIMPLAVKSGGRWYNTV